VSEKSRSANDGQVSMAVFDDPCGNLNHVIELTESVPCHRLFLGEVGVSITPFYGCHVLKAAVRQNTETGIDFRYD